MVEAGFTINSFKFTEITDLGKKQHYPTIISSLNTGNLLMIDYKEIINNFFLIFFNIYY